MAFLILSILMNVGIFTAFRLYPRYGIDTFQAIVINYVVCVITGIIFVGNVGSFQSITFTEPWLVISLFLGCVFVGGFYLTAITTQRFSMTVSSVASKISLAIPVLFALFIFDIESKIFDVWNFLGLFMALAAIYLTSVKSKTGLQTKNVSGLLLLLPVSVFLIGGAIDTTINYTNYMYLTKAEEAIFPVFVFLSAAIFGIILIIFKGYRFRKKNLKGGIMLGIINYFSLYFLVRALSAFNNDGAMVYPILNMGIIMLSAVVSVLFFHEKMERKNKLGLIISFLAIFLISYQELLIIFNF